MANTTPTKKYKFLASLFGILGWLVLTVPMIVYIVMAFVAGAVVSKVVLGLTGVAAIIMLAFSTMQKLRLRSPLWILTIGISLCLTEIYPLLIFMGVGTILDELVFSPLNKHYRNLYTINHEIDKRM